MPKLKITNFRLNEVFLFGQRIKIAGMAGAHNNDHLQTDTASGRLVTLRLLKHIQRQVYINLHESCNFAAEAKEVGLEYHWIRTEDFASQPLPPATFDTIYDIVKKATSEGKQVTISCGAGSGRTGTALAALKLRELVENEFREKAVIEEAPEANTSYVLSPYKGEVQCTPLVAQAVALIRGECITDPEAPSNGKNSVETQNDIHTLMEYEKHLRRKIADESTIYLKLFATDVFGPCLYAGRHPVVEGYKAAAFKNLPILKGLGIKKIFSLEKAGLQFLTPYWTSFGPQYQHIVKEDGVSYLVGDFEAPSLEQMDAISDSILIAISHNEKIYLHCRGGFGRTGTILAAVYMKKTGVSAQAAIQYVRTYYDKFAIETKEQEETLESFEQHLRKINYRMFAPYKFGNYLFVDPHPIPDESEASLWKNWSEIEKDEIQKYNPLEEKGSLQDFDAQSVEQLDKITNTVFEAIERKKSLFLHVGGDVEKTGVVLAAIYMKKTGTLAEEAIDFVRKNYNSKAVGSKEQVEALIKYGRFLNKKTEEEEMDARLQRLQTQIMHLPPKLKAPLQTVLTDVQNNKIPKEIAYETLVQTSLLLRPELQKTDWVSKYRELANKVQGHPSKACKQLAKAMFALAVIAAAVLMVGGMLGLGLSIIGGGAGGIAASLLLSYGFYRKGMRRGLSASMDNLALNVAANTISSQA